MAATLDLTDADRARIQNIIDYLEKGSAGHTLDDRAANDLALIFAPNCGFKCGCPGTLLEGLRDTPVSTLLRLILCVDA